MSPERRAGNRAREIVSSLGVRKVVVKLGSGTVTDPGAGLRLSTIRALAAQLSDTLAADGVSFVVVTSGAIAAGREKLGMASILDSIPGIGPSRRKTLLKHFGSVDKIRGASLEELKSVVPEDAARSIKEHLE